MSSSPVFIPLLGRVYRDEIWHPELASFYPSSSLVCSSPWPLLEFEIGIGSRQGWRWRSSGPRPLGLPLTVPLDVPLGGLAWR